MGELLPPDEDVVMFNHPRAGFAGTVVIGMFNSLSNPGGNPSRRRLRPELPLEAFPNVGLFTPSLYNKAVVGPPGTDTNALSFDAIELMNGGDLGGFTAVHDDWCSLVKQGLHKTATAVSDSHRLVMENAGFGRSFVASSTDDPAAIDEDELTSEREGHEPGRHERALHPLQRKGRRRREGADGRRPWCPPRRRWSSGPRRSGPVDSGRRGPYLPELRAHRDPCGPVVEGARKGELRFNRALPIQGIDADSFITVEASVKIDGSGNPVTPGLLETVQTIEPGVVPLGFTNPVFVDRDGNGYEPPGL